MSDYVIKKMTRKDLDQAIAWAAAEGWNPGLYDAECFYAADPNGFLMGWLDDLAVAAISAVKYGTQFGFIGFYLVKPEFRGFGYGLQIWQAALSSLKGRIVGLDGVVDQQHNYLKSGFELAYRNIRFEGFGQASTTAQPSDNLINLNQLPLADVIRYDQPFFPDDRTQFLQCWLRQPESAAIGYLQNGTLAGYGLLRPCRSGYKIGPLLADTAEIAEALLLNLKTQVPLGSPFYLDVPEVNRAGVDLVTRYGMQSMFETARMYTPRVPQLPTNRIFGVTSFELG